MNREPVPPTPTEDDRRKIARLDFYPICEIEDCYQRASRAVQCTHCNAIMRWFCMSHTANLENRILDAEASTCPECRYHDEMHNLTATVSLAGWF